MDIAKEVADGKAFISGLPRVLRFAQVGSSLYLPNANDVDFAVLLYMDQNAVDYACAMAQDGWGNCGEYDGVGGTWAAIRKDNLNLMITHDSAFFNGYVTAMEVCKALRLEAKEDRIAVCGIVRDGLTAEQVVTTRSPAPPVCPYPFASDDGKRIAALEAALALAIKEADGWHDDCRGGPCGTDGMAEARALIGMTLPTTGRPRW